MLGRQRTVKICFDFRNVQILRKIPSPIHQCYSRTIHTTQHVNRKLKSDEDFGSLSRENVKLSDQFNALKALTEQVQNVIKLKEEKKLKDEIENDLSLANETKETTEQDIDEVFESLGISSTSEDKLSEPLTAPLQTEQQQIQQQHLNDTNSNFIINLDNETDLMNLFPSPKPYVPLPTSINDVLTSEILSNITQKETSNWEPVVDALLKSGICDPTSSITTQESFTSFDFHKLITLIPRDQKTRLVEKLHELALLSGVLWGNVGVLNDLLALCNLLPKEQSHVLVTLLLRDVEMDEKIKNDNSHKEVTANVDKIVANTTTKAVLLNHYARLSDLKKVREYINVLNQLPDDKNPMKTSPVIYTSIMQMYMRLDNYELAKETFDTMKFLSLSTSPSSRTYTSMILLDTLHNDIEHGISVYEEMVDKQINIESQCLLALAKGCGARKGMVSQGWDFILKYYEAGYPIDSQLMEIMMYLAYVDGDLPFVRGIWINICETNTKLNGYVQLPHPKCTKWLFNSYYKIGDIVERAKNGHEHIPVGLVDVRVASIRSKVLELSNFQFHKDAPPLLPLKQFDGMDSKLMLSEARALWKYILTTKGNENYIGEELVEAYLYVVGRYGLLDIFESEWERLTIFDNTGLETNDNEPKVIIEEPNQEIDQNLEKNNNESKLTISEKTELPIGRIPRTDRLYNMCMHIARHQASLSFAQKIWTERGEYRKTERFQKLSVAKQDEADFKFARLMLSALTHTGNVGDAYKLVLSSQNRFIWTKYHLKGLIQLCERMGYVTFTKELLKVTRRGSKWIRRQQK